jgi:hypothetical protein
MAGFAKLSEVVLECRDPAALADFYSRLTGWVVIHADADWVNLAADRDARPMMAFQKAPGYRPPTWPDPASSMQMHLDFTVDDLDVAEQAALEIGAAKFDEQPSPDDFRVFADPEGHVFCLCA